MEPAEYQFWQEANAAVYMSVEVPCVDCPMAFASEMRARGQCNGTPRPHGGRRAGDGRGRLGWPKVS